MSPRGRAGSRTTVMIAAGGTGGHVYPALAVADRLRTDGCAVVWLGSRAGLEARIVPRAGIEIHFVPVAGLRGKGTLRWLVAPFTLAFALARAMLIILRCAPQVVLGMGGFASGPGGVAAWLLRRRLVVHEQNAVPGLTNRLLARLSDRTLEAFPGSFPARFRAHHTGNPVRCEVLGLPGPEARVVAPGAPLRVLVLGGSQGARMLNEQVPAALGALGAGIEFEVLHQAGARHVAATRDHYRAAGVPVRLTDFIDDIAAAYGWADLVIGRAGAMTVSELAAAGLPSILVPFPYATDDHQTANGRFLADAGAAVLIPESGLDRERLGRTLRELHGARDRLMGMARAARRLAKPDATEQVARLCLEACRG